VWHGSALRWSSPCGAPDADGDLRETVSLDRLEQRAGPQARAMLEQFLEQVKEVEAKYLKEETTD
jgi:hypothetical protein